jgi:predicted acyltransferase
MTLAGAVAVLVGAAWGVVFPVNKVLWTSSYAVLTGGLALLAFAACYAAIEIRGWRRWAAPFVVLGVNALMLFFLSTLAARVLTLIRVDGITLQRTIFERAFAPWAAPASASLSYAIIYLLAWWGVMWLFYRAGVRLRA